MNDVTKDLDALIDAISQPSTPRNDSMCTLSGDELASYCVAHSYILDGEIGPIIPWARDAGVILHVRPWSKSERYLAECPSARATGAQLLTTLHILKAKVTA